MYRRIEESTLYIYSYRLDCFSLVSKGCGTTLPSTKACSSLTLNTSLTSCLMAICRMAPLQGKWTKPFQKTGPAGSRSTVCSTRSVSTSGKHENLTSWTRLEFAVKCRPHRLQFLFPSYFLHFERYDFDILFVIFLCFIPFLRGILFLQRRNNLRRLLSVEANRKVPVYATKDASEATKVPVSRIAHIAHANSCKQEMANRIKPEWVLFLRELDLETYRNREYLRGRRRL